MTSFDRSNLTTVVAAETFAAPTVSVLTGAFAAVTVFSVQLVEVFVSVSVDAGGVLAESGGAEVEHRGARAPPRRAHLVE